MNTMYDILSTARKVLYEMWCDADADHTHTNDHYPLSSPDDGNESSELHVNFVNLTKRTVSSRREGMVGLVLDIGGVLMTVFDRCHLETKDATVVSVAGVSVVSGCVGDGGSDGKVGGGDGGGRGGGKGSKGHNGGSVGNIDADHVRPLFIMARRVQELCASLLKTPSIVDSIIPPVDKSRGGQGLDQRDQRPDLTLQTLFESNPTKQHSGQKTIHHPPPPLSSSSSASSSTRSKASGLPILPPVAVAVANANFRSTSMLFDRTATAWRSGRVGATER